jgi:hypothetical protein
MLAWLTRLTHKFRWRIHAFALGMTVALTAPLLSQGCAAGGT